MAQQLPEWNNPGVEPPQSLKDSGWAAGVKPSAQHFNWLLNRNFEVMKELQDIGSQATIDFKTDYNYQLGNVAGRQLRLTRISDVTRIPFLLESELPEGAAITVSIDGGNTSLPLRDIDGNDVTTLPKGFGEVVASGTFFTLVNKGGSLTPQQLQALIDIVNEMTANDNDLRQSFISGIITKDPSIPLNTNSTWNQILTQIPNIGNGKRELVTLSSTVTVQSSRVYQYANSTTNINSSYFSLNLGFKPSAFIASLRTTGNPAVSHDIIYQNSSDGYYTDTFKLVSSFNGNSNTSASSRMLKAASDTANFYENGILYVPTLLGAGSYTFSGIFIN